MAKRKKRKGGCSGADCWALGNAYRSIPGACSTGISSTVLKELMAESERKGREAASAECGEGCACAGRYHVNEVGTSALGGAEAPRCVWYVAGTWEGTCEGEGELVEGPTEEELGRITTDLEFIPETPRPTAPCAEQPCAALASARVISNRSAADGLDSALMTALIDRAAAAAQRAADRRCAAECACFGEFFVTDRGTVKIRPHGRTRYVWWVGGEWRGKCKKIY